MIEARLFFTRVQPEESAAAQVHSSDLGELSECRWVVVCQINVRLASAAGGCATSQGCDPATRQPWYIGQDFVPGRVNLRDVWFRAADGSFIFILASLSGSLVGEGKLFPSEPSPAIWCSDFGTSFLSSKSVCLYRYRPQYSIDHWNPYIVLTAAEQLHGIAARDPTEHR